MNSHINWNDFFFYQNTSVSNNIQRWNGEIPRLEYNENLVKDPHMQRYLQLRTEWRNEAINNIEARSRLINRRNTNPASVRPRLSNMTW